MDSDKSTIWFEARRNFESLTHAKDLKRNRLTLSGYFSLKEVIRDIVNRGFGVTAIENVADWCKRNGLIVTSMGYQSGWDIRRNI